MYIVVILVAKKRLFYAHGRDGWSVIMLLKGWFCDDGGSKTKKFGFNIK